MDNLKHMDSVSILDRGIEIDLGDDSISLGYLALLSTLAHRPPPQGFGNGVVAELARTCVSALCPQTGRVMIDPVLAADDCTYERSSVTEIFKRQKEICEQARQSFGLDNIDDVDNSVTASEAWQRWECPLGRGIIVDKTLRRNVAMRETVRDALIELIKSNRATNTELSTPRDVVTIDKLSEAFSKLDPLREVLKNSLDGKTPPMIVVVGSESSGKSTILERLAMMALFPRDENVCTKIQIHVQLRRCAPQEGRVSLKVVSLDAEGRVGGTERESRPIPMEGGHADVRREMQELLELEHGRVHEARQHVCTSRAIVLEIESPNVPSIDLVDMPGLNSYGHQETTLLLDRHHQVHGAKCMYLLVMRASDRPVNDFGGQFIINNDLQHKTCGVFTQTDELSPRHLALLQNYVLSSDAATASASQEDASMAASEAANQGSIPLKPYGWVVTSNKPPSLPTDASSFQRLSQQAEDEIALFRDNQPVDDTGILRALFDSHHATSGALIMQLSKMYGTFLNETWAPSTFMQIDEQISVLEYEIAMLGSQGNAAWVEEAAGAEVNLRLNKFLPSYYVTFNTEVAIPYNNQCQNLIKQLTSMSAEVHEHAVEFIARLQEETERVQNELMSAKDSVLAKVRTFWAKAFTDILMARYSLDEESLKYVMKVNQVGDDANTRPQAKVFASLSYFIDKMFATKKKAMASATAQPPFQLAEYPKYVDSIIDALDAKLMLRMNVDTKGMVEDMINLVDYVNSKSRSTPLLSLAFQEDLTQATVTIDTNRSYDFCVALLKHIPCMKDMLNIRSNGTGIYVGNEQAASFDMRESLDHEINELSTARKAIRVALGWNEERSHKARTSMSDEDQEAARNAAATAAKKSVPKR